MEERTLSSDAVECMYRGYIRDDLEAQEFLEGVRIQADLAVARCDRPK